MKTLKYFFVILTIFVSVSSFSQDIKKDKYKNQFSLLFGLNQPIVLGGFNFEGNYWMKKFVIDYSHGIGLHMDGEFIGGETERQQLDILVKHSLGIGFGYRVTERFNVRLEPKFHFFDVYYKGEDQTAANRIEEYSTFTLGIGAYYRWLPFEKKENAWKGLTIAPSVRYWPNVSSSLEGNTFTYSNKITGQKETHEAMNIGAGNTPWIFNVSIGYTFR